MWSRTAFELRRPVQINGEEHFAEKLKQFSCFGQPIRNPASQRIEGVLDFTALDDRANPLLSALITHAVDDIERRLVDGTRTSERNLLAAFQAAAVRKGHAIVALGDELVLSNPTALDVLNSADIAMLRALTSHGRPTHGVLDAP